MSYSAQQIANNKSLSSEAKREALGLIQSLKKLLYLLTSKLLTLVLSKLLL